MVHEMSLSEVSMKPITRLFFASALATALSAMAYGQAVNVAGGIAKPGASTGSTKTLNEAGYGSPGDTRTDAGTAIGVGAAGNGPTTPRSHSAKTNGLNKGTNSGANSDVNGRPGGLRNDH
jgi:hypothetical protein